MSRRTVGWLGIGGGSMAEAVVWRTSSWDHQVHAFRPGMIGEVTAEAVCAHSARASRLVEPDDVDRRCLACLLLHGDVQQQTGPATATGT